MGFLGFKELKLRGIDFKQRQLFESPSFGNTGIWRLNKARVSDHAYSVHALMRGEQHLPRVQRKEIHCDDCGFHSWKRPEFVQRYACDSWFAVVDNFSEVVEHQFGYRASQSKIIYITQNVNELTEWVDQPLSDTIGAELIEWANDPSTKSHWVMPYEDDRDRHTVVKNYLHYWVANLDKVDKLRIADIKNPEAHPWGRRM